MSKIAVIGIAGESVFLTVDGFGATGETVQANAYHSELGGKGFNQAVAVSRYGEKVSFLCACYSGDVECFTKTAEQNGIKAFFVGKRERSPYAVITTDKQGDNKVCVYRGAELDEQDMELFAYEIKTADILLINNEVPISVNERAVKIAKENGVKVVLNPAPTRKYNKQFLDKIDLFTPNEHETDGLDDYQNLIVTLGDKGCFIRNENKVIPAEKVQTVVDTTGAGDTFNGVLAACLASGCDLQAACKKANVASAIKVMGKYILDSIPTREEIENYLEQKMDKTYFNKIVENLEKINETQSENIKKAASLMADAIEQDRLINVYGGGGHTTLCMGEMFFRAGGLANINPIAENGLTVFNQALKYLELERTVNYGSAIMKYYKLQPGDLLIVFHNIGINPATIDAVMEAKKAGAKIVAISSSYWQNEMPADHFIRHPNKTNLFDYADVCIDDFNPVGDAVIEVEGFETPIAPVSNIVDFYIAHMLEIECVKECQRRGIKAPCWSSANTPGGDEKNAAYLAKYSPRIKML